SIKIRLDFWITDEDIADYRVGAHHPDEDALTHIRPSFGLSTAAVELEISWGRTHRRPYVAVVRTFINEKFVGRIEYNEVQSRAAITELNFRHPNLLCEGDLLSMTFFKSDALDNPMTLEEAYEQLEQDK